VAGGLVTGLAGSWLLVHDTSPPASLVGTVTLRFDGSGALPAS